MVVNEAAVRAMNMDSPIGKKFHFWDFDGIIIGVIKDFHFKSLHTPIEPMVMKLDINLQKIAIRIHADNTAATIGFIEKEIKKIVPNYTFQFEFLDQKLNRLYRAEQRMENITQAISFLAIFISCLGLLGLTAFTAEKKKKEIGIRKVLGTSVSGVVYLLSLKFIKWVLIATIIACPAAYLAAKAWRRHYAYCINIEVEIFILSSAIALLITLLTISYQSIKAAAANPVEALKYE
jgi:putative ABC transport system permease protein